MGGVGGGGFTDYPFNGDRSPMRYGVAHGTWESWKKGCRCKLCVAAARRRTNANRAKKAATRGLHPNDPRHGTANGYRYHGCRCARCGAAEKERARQANENRKERRRAARRVTDP